MLSMALRVGQALCLHLPEPPFQVSPFEQEMRRRCWQCIGLLDVAASQDRASEPMMQAAWLNSHPPANINDDDIWMGMDGPIREHPEGTFTDMTHPLIIASAQTVNRSLSFSDFSEATVNCMTSRQQIVNDFQRTVSTLLSGCRPDLSAFQRFSRQATIMINGWLQLGSLRPFQRSKQFTPPPVQGDTLLRLAADNLQIAMNVYSDPELAAWRWFGTLWVPWHGLAVALAELAVYKDPSAMSKYWPVVEGAFQRSSMIIADSQHGMLWRPLEKLMTQVRARKRELLGSVSPGTALRQTSQGAPSPPVSMGNTIPVASPPQQIPLPIQPPAASYPLDLETTMAAGQPVNPAMAMPPGSFSFDVYPNIWDSMDLSNPVLDVQGDNAWLNYDSFMGDLYDSVDSMFLPR